MPSPIQYVAELLRRVRFYLNRERFERELAEEMRFHVEMKARDHESAGMSAEDAALGGASTVRQSDASQGRRQAT